MPRRGDRESPARARLGAPRRSREAPEDGRAAALSGAPLRAVWKARAKDESLGVHYAVERDEFASVVEIVAAIGGEVDRRSATGDTQEQVNAMLLITNAAAIGTTDCRVYRCVSAAVVVDG